MTKSEFFEILVSLRDQSKSFYECFSIINSHLLKLLPQSLYRYRKINENSIDAFEKDLFVTVSATGFNDPYDTLVSYHLDDMKESLQGLTTKQLLDELKFKVKSDKLLSILGKYTPTLKRLDEVFKNKVLTCVNEKELANCIFDVMQTQTFKNEVIDVFMNILRKYATIGCLCEQRDSILMWSHYADSHKGFLLEYNAQQLLIESAINKALLLPVDYKQLRYNATELVLSNVLNTLGLKLSGWNELQVLEVMLRKSIEWGYEKEWRVIRFPKNESGIGLVADTFVFKPSAIYYGSKISTEDRAKLHAIAESKQIKEFDMFMNEASNYYRMDIRQYQ